MKRAFVGAIASLALVGGGGCNGHTPSTASSAMPSASSTPRAASSASNDGGASFTGATASALTALGATYLCDQRIHAAGGGPHLSVWEWTSTDAPETLADRIAAAAGGSERDDPTTFRWKGADGSVTVVVTVTTPGASPASCGTPAPGTNARVIVSRR